MDAELQTIKDVVAGATLTEEVRQAAGWCLGQLPKLYERLAETSDDRYREEIRRLVHGVLKKLAGKTKGCPDAPRVAEAIRGGLGDMHERLGLPGLALPHKVG